MVHIALEKYILNARKNGFNDRIIREKLILAGYHPEFVNDFFSKLDSNSNRVPAEKFHFSGAVKLWRNTCVFGIIVLIFSCLYLYSQSGDMDILMLNKAIACSAMVLIGIALALSAVCYYWAFAETKFVYRKYFGMCGFFFACVHVLITLAFLQYKFPFPAYYAIVQNRLPFAFAVMS